MSNIVVKMMSDEKLDDSNLSKGFEIVEAFGEVQCYRAEDKSPIISIPLENGQTAIYHPKGNTYILHKGKTVSTFSFEERKDCKVVATKMSFEKTKPKIKIDLLNLSVTETRICGKLKNANIGFNGTDPISKELGYVVQSDTTITLSTGTSIVYEGLCEVTNNAEVILSPEGREDEFDLVVVEVENKPYLLHYDLNFKRYVVITHPAFK